MQLPSICFLPGNQGRKVSHNPVAVDMGLEHVNALRVPLQPDNRQAAVADSLDAVVQRTVLDCQQVVAQAVESLMVGAVYRAGGAVELVQKRMFPNYSDMILVAVPVFMQGGGF